jgi:hypothetical protein
MISEYFSGSIPKNYPIEAGLLIKELRSQNLRGKSSAPLNSVSSEQEAKH